MAVRGKGLRHLAWGALWEIQTPPEAMRTRMGKETGKGPVRGCGEHLRGFQNGMPGVSLSIERALLRQLDEGSVELDLSAVSAALLKRPEVLDDPPFDLYRDQ